MNNRVFKLTTLAIATSLLAACGGGGGGSDKSFNSKKLDGVAVDFYVANATVNFDDCDTKTETNSEGKFVITTSPNCQATTITIKGGTDTATGLPFTGTLKSKTINLQNRSVDNTPNAKPEIVLSPLTTLEYYAEEQDIALDDLLDQLDLGHLSGTDFSTFDPQESAEAEDMAKIFILQQLANLIEKNDPSVSGFEQIIEALNNSADPLFDSTNGELNTTLVTAIINSDTASGLSSIYEAITNAIENNPDVALSELIKEDSSIIEQIIEVVQPYAYSDILVAGKTLSELKASNESPIDLSIASLNTLLNVSFKSVATEGEVIDTIQVGFKLEGKTGSQTETLDVIVNQVDLAFNDGSLTAAIIPAGTRVSIASTLYGVEETEFTINNDINLGSTINLDTLVQSNATLQGYYNRFYGLLPVGANVAAEAYVKSGNFSTTVAGLSPATISVGDLSFTGESLKAYFKLTQ